MFCLRLTIDSFILSEVVIVRCIKYKSILKRGLSLTTQKLYWNKQRQSHKHCNIIKPAYKKMEWGGGGGGEGTNAIPQIAVVLFSVGLILLYFYSYSLLL